VEHTAEGLIFISKHYYVYEFQHASIWQG